MAQLLDLANELLLAINDVIHVEDIEAFTISNKRIHSLSQNVLLEHRAMKQNYSKVKLRYLTPTTLDVSLENHPLAWLREIILNETVASYPTHLYIRDRFAATDRIKYHFSSEMMMCIYSKIEQCPYIQREHLACWKRDIFRESESFDTALALLLTLLPNLQFIFFDIVTRYTRRVPPMFVRIAKASQTDRNRSHALSRLVSLDQSWGNHPWERSIPLDLYLPFTGLPSVRSVSGNEVYGYDNESFGLEDAEGILKTSNSGITTIKFTKSNISSSGFEDLLCRIGALQDFEYEYRGFELDGFEPRKIVNSLLSNAGHSLVRLHLIDDNSKDSPDRGEDGGPVLCGNLFIGSLREFQVLKAITVNNAMLIEKNLNTETGGKESFKVHRLVDLLPTSIEELSVECHPNFCLPGNIFDGLVESRAQRFPKLEKIRINCFDRSFCDMEEAYHELGIDAVQKPC